MKAGLFPTVTGRFSFSFLELEGRGGLSIEKNVEEVQFRDFLRFGEKQGLSSILNSMPEKRESPEIGSGMVGQGVAVGAGLGVESLRHLDHALREPGSAPGSWERAGSSGQ